MTNNTPKRSGRQQYSIGTLIVTVLLVLIYWWMTGSLPNMEQTESGNDVANAPITTSTPSPAATNRVIVEIDDEATEIAATTAAITAATDAPAPVEVTEAVTVTIAPIEEAVEESTVEGPTATAIPTLPPPTAVPATDTPQPPPTATLPPEPTATPANPPRAGPPGIPEIAYDDLPREALETIILIIEDGPFPFDRDGITFQNREGLLPDEPRGYYKEYTVITPGVSTRGARRIVAGAEGEFYYTDDHYESFSWVVLP